jgi:hypothetical protein
MQLSIEYAGQDRFKISAWFFNYNQITDKNIKI